MKFKILMIGLLLASVFLIAACSNKVLEDEPKACTLEYVPVCGVDGQTYSNKCVAGDVAIAHEGECAKACTKEYMPVCGVDGQTYGNKCTAGDVEIAYEGECIPALNMTNPASTFCVSNGGTLEIRKDANDGEVGYCKLNGNECEEWSLFRGECSEFHICTVEEKAAELCTMEYMPVCGNDGITYGNKCGACSADVAYWIAGEC